MHRCSVVKAAVMQGSICLQIWAKYQQSAGSVFSMPAVTMAEYILQSDILRFCSAAHSTSSLFALLCPSLLPRLLLAGGGRGGRANSEYAPAAAMEATLAAAAANADAPVCISTNFMTAPTDSCQQMCCTPICQSRRRMYDLAVSQLYS